VSAESPRGPSQDLDQGVVVLRSAALSPPRGWLTGEDVAVLVGSVEAVHPLILDLRYSGFSLGGGDAGTLAEGLADHPMVAIIADPGVSYGCARMACTRVELRGKPSAAFTDEAEAWRWLSAQLAVELREATPPVQ
jgi:hypothetical protein